MVNLTIKEYTKDTFDFITSEFDDKDLEYFISKITSMVENYLERYEEIQEENAYNQYIDMIIDEQKIRESEVEE